MNSKTFNSKAFTRLFFCMATLCSPMASANAETPTDSLSNNESKMTLSSNESSDMPLAINESRKMPLNSIRIKGGFTFVTSRLFSDDDELSSPWGYGFGIDYTHLWKTKTSSNEKPQYIGFTLTAQYKAASQGYEIDTSFFGAGFTWASKTNKGFAWHTTVGLGYAYSTDLDLYLDNGGLGIFGTVGFDYMLTKHLGIGLSLNPLVCFYSKPDFYDKTDFYGVAHYDVNLGLSWHF